MENVIIAVMKERKPSQIKMTAEADAVIVAELKRCGMTKIELLSRVVSWYCQQDDVVRGAVAGIIPPSVAPDVARYVLERMAAESKKKAG